MMNWLISGHGLPALIIPAESFDDALAIARERDPRYDTGQVTSKFVDDKD